MTASELQSPARLAGVVYADEPGLDDPAELYHEASKLSGATATRALSGSARLAASPELRRVAAAASLRHPELPLLPLPEPLPLEAALGAALSTRRSARSFGAEPLPDAALATLLESAYGVTGALADGGGWEQPVRAAPSGGALYPLDLYVAAQRLEDLPRGLYRFEPLGRALEALDSADAVDAVADSTAYPALAGAAAATVAIAATFWRSRFKYGLRAYRFALLEAGHVAQNLLLAAAALGLAAVPLGGFYDRRLDEALRLDGVDRSALYLVCVGARAEAR